MPQCPELDFQSCGYSANRLIKLEIKSPESWLLVLVHAVWSGEAACLGIWGAALCITRSRLPLLVQLWSKGSYSIWVWVMVIWKMGSGGKNSDRSLWFSDCYS